MATGWVKSWQCKSRALDDVVNNHHHHQYHLLPNSASCKNGVKSLKDVVENNRNGKPRKKKSGRQPELTRPGLKGAELSSNKEKLEKSRASTSTRLARARTDSFFPALTELPEGHPSRNVVGIIFQTSWSPKVFTGRVEMVFKVQNLPRTATRFEEYRDIVKSRGGTAAEKGGEDHARCVADGNEVMRFYCLGPTNGGAYEATGSAWTFSTGKGAAVCTYSGSGAAHENAGGGRGRRAMLVCRVIAGRVCKELGFDSLIEGRVGYDSVSGDNGELLVFDSRAVLPCFLIIYKL
ncbi:putative adenine phosphoribosyltransferase 1, chloroplastic-like [Capsicum annuum]|uniref:uncharacterized protein LOC107852666 n=1 Tax=Capsicum annuum TaxID=4072 RepID=UPI0007BFA75D|nr:uncharacterized protein LOC107852666 [Capsicum annuum]KAF3615764.1 putative adenine phosphoribosyltransferase 1, chloroplastic-like [Capsicum annuum]KAF3615798.1 putative adenine phosphoribosyltransferase 1, chloroplastic-like [Capsicum annuum]